MPNNGAFQNQYQNSAYNQQRNHMHQPMQQQTGGGLDKQIVQFLLNSGNDVGTHLNDLVQAMSGFGSRNDIQ